jgi:hypothetical protein
LGSQSTGISDKVAVSAFNLAQELNLRFESAFVQGAGILVTSQSVEVPGGDPADPTDNILQYTVNVDPSYGGFVPVGAIIMWSGTIEEMAVNPNWAVCNGQTKNGRTTPNLLNRFIKGATVTANNNQSGGPTLTGTTGETALQQQNIPVHVHGELGGGVTSILGGTNGATYSNVVISTGDAWTGGGGACVTEGKCAPGNQNSLGNPAVGHSHSLSGISAVEPLWYSLAYIMRVQ